MIDKIEIDFNKIRPAIGEQHISISTALCHLCEPFDEYGMAKRTWMKYYNDKKSKYYKKQIVEILNMWRKNADIARDYGRKLDEYVDKKMTADDYAVYDHKIFNGYEVDEKYRLICDGFNLLKKNWLDPSNIEYIAREKTLYLKTKYGWMKGRLDFLGYNLSTKKFVIIDWKTSAAIESMSYHNKKMLGPCEGMDDCNGNTYGIQTAFYKHALLENYLPEGTDSDDIEVYICQIPGRLQDNLPMYAVYPTQIKYNTEFLNRIYDYAWSRELKSNKSKIVTHTEEYEDH